MFNNNNNINRCFDVLSIYVFAKCILINLQYFTHRDFYVLVKLSCYIVGRFHYGNA